MRFQQLLLLPLALAFLASLVNALPEKQGQEGVDEDDCPSVRMLKEEEEYEEAERLAEEAAKLEAAQVNDPWPDACDAEDCEVRIGKTLAIIEHEIDMITVRLDATKKLGDEKLAITDSLKPKIAELEKVTEESKNAEEAAKKEFEAAKKATAASYKDMVTCNSSSAGKIKALELKIAKAKAEADEYANSFVIFNPDLIMSDVKGLLKKVGLVKDEL